MRGEKPRIHRRRLLEQPGDSIGVRPHLPRVRQETSQGFQLVLFVEEGTPEYPESYEGTRALPAVF